MLMTQRRVQQANAAEHTRTHGKQRGARKERAGAIERERDPAARGGACGSPEAHAGAAGQAGHPHG